MRTLATINNPDDVYQAVPADDIALVERDLNFKLPQELRNIYLAPDIQQLQSLPTLLWPVHHDTIGIIETNRQLQSRDYDPFPHDLISFATNECGDFWVIDTKDQSVTYIDPDRNVAENLADPEMRLKDFTAWLQLER